MTSLKEERETLIEMFYLQVTVVISSNDQRDVTESFLVNLKKCIDRHCFECSQNIQKSPSWVSKNAKKIDPMVSVLKETKAMNQVLLISTPPTSHFL